MTSLIPLGRFAFFIGLTVAWAVLFLIPGFKRFLAGEVGVVVSTEEAKSLPAPAVTLCPYEYHFQGWKNSSPVEPIIMDSYILRCKDASTTQDFVTCIENKTFNLNETLPYGASHGLGHSLNNQLMNPKFWIEDMTTAVNGRCFTLNYTAHLSTDMETDSIVFNFANSSSSTMRYLVFIHQLDFFIVNWNPLAMPRIKKVLDVADIRQNYKYIYLKVNREEKMNRPEAPCTQDKNYYFNSCIKKSVSNIVGCKLPWDKTTRGKLFSCCHNQFKHDISTQIEMS